MVVCFQKSSATGKMGHQWPSQCVGLCVRLCMFDSVTKANVIQVLFQSHCNPLPSPDSNQAGRTVNRRSGLNNRHQSGMNATRRKILPHLNASFLPCFPSRPKPLYPPSSFSLILSLSSIPFLTLLQHLPNTEAFTSLPMLFFSTLPLFSPSSIHQQWRIWVFNTVNLAKPTHINMSLTWHTYPCMQE